MEARRHPEDELRASARAAIEYKLVALKAMNEGIADVSRVMQDDELPLRADATSRRRKKRATSKRAAS